MSQLIPFDSSSNLPAYLKGAEAATNSDILSHASTSYPIISIKGKAFTVVRDGVRELISHPLDPDTAASKIDMVLVKVNKGTSKVFYAKGYTEGSDDKPDCFSNDGVRPDPSVERKVSPTCASCPKNVWGSKITEQGKKVKACSDSVRVAIARPDQINDPYFIRVPPASIKNLGEFGKMLDKRKVPYQAVVTEISFDKEQATPLLTFKPKAFLTPEQYEEVKQIAAGDIVQAIMGSNYMEDQEGAGDAASNQQTAAPAPEPEAAAPAPAAKTKPTPKPKPTPAPEVTEDEVSKAVAAAQKPAPAPVPSPDGDFDIDDIQFDD